MSNPPSLVPVLPGSFEEALAHGQRLLEQDPSAALKQAEGLVGLKQDARVFRLAAAACRKLGYTADANGAELGAIKASHGEPELQEGALALSEGRDTEALRIARKFLRKSPDDLLALTLAAEASINLRDYQRAEPMLWAILERAPTFLRVSLMLATCFTTQVRMRDAIAVLNDFVKHRPDNLQVLTGLAQLLAEVGDNEQATVIYERLAALDGGQPDRWAQLGHSYRIVGRRDDSIRAFRRAFAIDRYSGPAWWGLANYFSDDLNEQDEEVIGMALRQRVGQPDEAALQLSLALIADRKGDWATAFDHFLRGKKSRLDHQPYSPEPISTAVDSVIDLLTPEFYERRSGSGWPDPSPIFVIGMHRSGTTLVERILGCHSAIEGAGEMRIVPKLAEAVRHQADSPEHYAAMLESLEDSQLAWVGKRYMQSSGDFRRTAKPRFIDKNNLNWMQVGLILLALPDATIIDVRRNALDCCWANFKMLFSEGFPATNDLHHVGKFYRDYVRLFDAVKTAAPDRVLSVKYEDVVDDIEGQTRRMLNFLDLEYEPKCIDFHLAEGAVATASSEQVRQPLNRRGIGAWRPYAQWLEPLREALGPLADADQ